MSVANAQTPLRTAIIGLSSSAATSWASTAHLPCFNTARGKRDFVITALCNSSVPAAEAAIEKYGLGGADQNTRAHGTPADLAADPDVRFVVCNTRVDKHHETTLPSIRAGKDAYIEWPIAATAAHVDELAAAARASGSRVAVGLQGRWAPPILKVKELLRGGDVGKLLSSDLRAFGGAVDRGSLSAGLEYFAEKKIGGNPVVIGFGHVIDFVQSVVGDLEPHTTHARMQIQRPNKRIRHPENPSETLHYRETDVPDLVSVHGSLPATEHVAENATLTAAFRTGQPFKGQPALTWTLNGEKGEIRLTAITGISLQADAFQDPVSIQVHDYATDTAKSVAWTWSETQMEVPARARSVQSCLYAFAEGNEQGWVSIEDAAKRAKQIHGWFEQAGYA